MKKGRYPKAFRSFCRLRNSPLQAARDMFYVWAQLEEEKAILDGTTYFGRVRDLFVVPRVRRATLGAFVVMLAQQMCTSYVLARSPSGRLLTLLLSWSSRRYQHHRLLLVDHLRPGRLHSSKRAQGFAGFRRCGEYFLLTHPLPSHTLADAPAFVLQNFLFAFPAIFTIDTFGRRNLLLATFPNMAWTLLAAGLCFLIPDESPAHIGLIAFFIFLFAAFYSPGEGPVPFTYSAEVFPLTHREIGMGFVSVLSTFCSLKSAATDDFCPNAFRPSPPASDSLPFCQSPSRPWRPL